MFNNSDKGYRLKILNMVLLTEDAVSQKSPYTSRESLKADLNLFEEILLAYYGDGDVEEKFIPPIFDLKDNTIILSPWVKGISDAMAERGETIETIQARVKFILSVLGDEILDIELTDMLFRVKP